MKKFLVPATALAVVVSVLLAFCLISEVKESESLSVQLENLRQSNEDLRQSNEDLRKQNEELDEANKRLLTLSSKEDVTRVVMAEARGSSLKAQAAVAQTILDRSVQRGKSSGEIISAPDQYATPYEGAMSDLSEFAVDLIYLYGYRVFEEPTTHFYAYEQCEPDWSRVKEERGIIEGHRFMY